MKALKKTVRKMAGRAARPAGRRTTPAKRRSAPKFTAKPVKEITATFPDCIGLTSQVAAALAAENVNILAATGYSASGYRTMATFTFIVDNLAKAEKALDKLGANDIHDLSVIMVETENRIGALERISRIIADAGINIYYFYSTTNSGKTATCIFKTADDRRAVRILHEA